MEIAARDDGVLEHEWVVGGTIQLNLKDSAGVCERVPHRTVDLRDAAQAIGILNAATFAVTSGNRARMQELREVLRAQYLSGVRPSRMQTMIEGRGRST